MCWHVRHPWYMVNKCLHVMIAQECILHLTFALTFWKKWMDDFSTGSPVKVTSSAMVMTGNPAYDLQLISRSLIAEEIRWHKADPLNHDFPEIQAINYSDDQSSYVFYKASSPSQCPGRSLWLCWFRACTYRYIILLLLYIHWMSQYIVPLIVFDHHIAQDFLQHHINLLTIHVSYCKGLITMSHHCSCASVLGQRLQIHG